MNANWQRALDTQMDQHKWHVSDTGLKLTLTFFYDYMRKKMPQVADKDNITLVTKDVISTLWRADTMYVTEDMQHLLMQAAHDLPDDVVWTPQMLICPIGFVMFEETMYGKDINGATLAINAMAWSVQPSVLNLDTEEMIRLINVYFFTPTDDMEDDINREIIPVMRERGEVVPPLALSHWYPAVEGKMMPPIRADVPTELIVGTLKLFYAMHLIAQQTIGEAKPMSPNRHARKRAANYWKDSPSKIITLITLRRKSAKSNGEPGKVEWSRRWIVKGHWHKYWYPSLKRHGYVYLHDYVKGPEDKPLIVTERRVFNFRR